MKVLNGINLNIILGWGFIHLLDGRFRNHIRKIPKSLKKSRPIKRAFRVERETSHAGRVRKNPNLPLRSDFSRFGWTKSLVKKAGARSCRVRRSVGVVECSDRR